MAKFKTKFPKKLLQPLVEFIQSQETQPEGVFFSVLNGGYSARFELRGQLIRLKVSSYHCTISCKFHEPLEPLKEWLGKHLVLTVGFYNLAAHQERLTRCFDLMAADVSFRDAVYRLEYLWKAKGQPLDPLEETPEELKVSPRYNIDGSEGQSLVDPLKVNPPSSWRVTMPLRTFCSLSRMEDLRDYLQAKNLPTREGKGQFQAMQVYINGKWEILYLSNAYPDSCFTVGASPLKLLLEVFLKGKQ